MVGPANLRKSVLECLLGLTPPDDGILQLAGQNPWTLTPTEWLRLRKHIGLASLEFPLIATLDVLTNLTLAINYHTNSRATATQHAEQLAATFPIAVDLTQLPEFLTPLAYRLALVARSLMLEQGILAVDGIFRDLNPAEKKQLFTWLLERVHAGNPTLLISTTDLALIARLECSVLFVAETTRIIFPSIQALTSSRLPEVVDFLDEMEATE